jgi:hypothetical protein
MLERKAFDEVSVDEVGCEYHLKCQLVVPNVIL